MKKDQQKASLKKKHKKDSSSSSSSDDSSNSSNSHSNSSDLSDEQEKLDRMLSKKNLAKLKDLGDKVALAKGTKKAIKTIE